MHPLSPIIRGGLVVVVIIGIVVANLRDRAIAFFVPGSGAGGEGDPIDFILREGLLVAVALIALGIVIVIVLCCVVVWRFHTFRITGDHVEVRRGILFRSHRRSPLDRVQGVNLTRPMIPRLLGMAKLEVVGAGADANVKLEYLTTSNAETIRGDILRLASGRQLAEQEASSAASPNGASGRLAGVSAAVESGFHGLIDGVDAAEEPASVVNISAGRIILSHIVSGSTVFLLLLIIAIIVWSAVGSPLVLLSLIPVAIAWGIGWFSGITKQLRYSIAPTRAGVRITFGLFTTVTETLPPGRVHAVEVTQSPFWRPFGWYAVRVTRMSGASLENAAAAQQKSQVLPVGTLADVDRVLRLLFPSLSDAEWGEALHHGVRGAHSDDPYLTMPERARIFRPLSWRRNGMRLTENALYLRRGRWWQKLSILLLARIQSIRVDQGPWRRGRDLADLHVHTVAGPVTGYMTNMDRTQTLAMWDAVSAASVRAARQDRSHRWDEGAPDMPPAPAPIAPPPVTPPIAPPVTPATPLPPATPIPPHQPQPGDGAAP